MLSTIVRVILCTPSPSITDKKSFVIDDGFILTYDENGTQNKYVMKIGIGSINAMIITYPMDKEEEYKNMVNAIIGNFTPGDLSASY